MDYGLQRHVVVLGCKSLTVENDTVDEVIVLAGLLMG